MANIKNLEMATSLSNDSRIIIKKSLFGQKAVYEPTQSELTIQILEYAPDAGARLEHLLAEPQDKLLAELQSKGCPKSTPVGQYRLEVVQSKDGKFAAMQLFRFADFVYHKASRLIACDGADVAIVDYIISNQ